MMKTRTFDLIVIGAGISGLLAARAVQATGARVLVLEKSRGVGGRMATRRIGSSVFDHGAQYFTARDPGFQQMVESWQKAGVVKPWGHGFALAKGGFKEDGIDRYCGVTSMTALPKYLAQTLDIRLNTKVARIVPAQGRWDVETPKGEHYAGRALLLTAPLPQSLELLAAGNILLPEQTHTGLARIEYAPCLALLARLSGSSLIPEPGGLWFSEDPIAWMADNRLKGVSSGKGAAVTIHASPTFSHRHWESPEELVVSKLLGATDPWLGSEVRSTQLHRWRYGLPLQVHSERCVVVSEPAPLVIAGDAFAGPRVEGAALSGMAAGEYLSRRLQS